MSSGKLVSAIREMRQRLTALRQETAELESELAQAAAMLGEKATQPTSDETFVSSVTRPPVRVRPIRKTSATGAALRVLKQAQTPLEVDAIIGYIERMYGMPVKKTTLVSGLAKYVRAHDTFTRPSPGVYGLIEFEKEEVA